MIFDVRNAIMTTVAAISIAAAATPAFAQSMEERRVFNIPPQSVTDAILAFSRQSNIQVVTASAGIGARQSRGVRGRLTGSAALERLLAGTGLVWRQTGQGSIVVEPGSGEAGAAGAAATSEGAADQQLTVTGTRIRGSSNRSSPLRLATREEIQQRGDSTVADYLNTIPENFPNASTGNVANPSSGIFNLSAGTGANLRGLGPESTLTLINGRRMAPSGGSRGGFVDVSMIPLSALERVEILTDGASAIYGSDAVGGVVNLILRRTYEGFESSGRFGISSRGDSPEYRLGQLVGQSWGSGSVLLAYEYFDRDQLFSSERERTRSGDRRPLGGSDFRPPFNSPGTVTNIPSTVNLPGLSSPFAAVPPNQDGRQLTRSDFLAGQRNFDESAINGIYPGERRHSFFGNVRQELGMFRIEGSVGFSHRRLDQTFVHPQVSAVVPATNPFNPFGRAVLVQYRFERELPAVSTDSTARTLFLNGSIANAEQRRFNWELAGSYTEDRSNRGAPNVNTAAVNAALALTDPNRALNLFGDGSGQNVSALDGLLQSTELNARLRTAAVTGKIDGDLIALPAGPLKIVVGGEYRHERLRDEAIAPPFFQSTAGSRNVWAVFAEALVPVARSSPIGTIDLSLAARYEHYSDFGNATNPRIGIVWEPIRSLMLRASWGRSFRAPKLFDLFSAQFEVTSTVADPRTGITAPIFIVNGGNPNLGPERANIWSAGAVFRPDFIPGARLEANYYSIKYRDRIFVAFTPLTLIPFEDQVPPGIFERDSSGRLIRFNGIPFNASVLNTDGVDVLLGYTRRAGPGTIGFNAAVSHILNYDQEFVPGAGVIERVGTFPSPAEWRGRADLSYSTGNFTISGSYNYVSGNRLLINRLPSGEFQQIGSHQTFNLVSSIDVLANNGLVREARFRLGVQNLFDRDPPWANTITGFDPAQADIRGRYFFFEVAARY